MDDNKEATLNNSEELENLLDFIVNNVSDELPTLTIDLNYFLLGAFIQKDNDLFKRLNGCMLSTAIKAIYNTFYEVVSSKALSAVKPNRIPTIDSKLSEMIKNKKVERKYLALIWGSLSHEKGRIEAPIGRDPENRQTYIVTDINSKDSITNFKVIERLKEVTLIECILETGRTHQIRVHLSHIGYPIIGDDVYSNGKNRWNIEGQCLHAKELDFKHPITGKQMHIEAELPEYFKKILEELDWKKKDYKNF